MNYNQAPNQFRTNYLLIKMNYKKNTKIKFAYNLVNIS